MRSYLYQINVTRDCNLRCSHCYIHSEVKTASKKMPLEQVELIAKGIVEHMRKTGYERAEIHFIGGEPTLLGLPFFEKALPMMRAMFQGEPFTPDLMLVTNLLSNEILPICALFDRVATSYEPETRFISWTGAPKPKLEARWLETVKELQSRKVNLSVTTAMTKPVIDFGARRLLDWFYGHGIKQIHFGFFIPEGDGLVNKFKVFPEFHETSAFLIEAADWYLERRNQDPDLWVNPFESMLGAIDSNAPFDDIVCPIISGSIDIHWDGSAAPCLEAGGALEPDWCGNVFEQGIAQVTQSPKFLRKVFEATRPQRACLSCEEYSVCKSGCGVLFKFWDPTLDQDCPGFKRFIKHVRTKHSEGLRPRATSYHGKSC